jgi:golgi phosphoprotein 3
VATVWACTRRSSSSHSRIAGARSSGELPSAAIGGAILGELLLEKRIRLDGKSGRSSGAEPKNPFVELVDDEPPGCPVLDEALERIALAARRGRVGDWVSRFANRRNVHRHIAEQLCRRGILREDEESVLLFFKRKIYPEVNPVPERKLLDRLEKAVFGDESVDDRTAMLVVLAMTAGCWKRHSGSHV